MCCVSVAYKIDILGDIYIVHMSVCVVYKVWLFYVWWWRRRDSVPVFKAYTPSRMDAASAMTGGSTSVRVLRPK